MLVDEMYDEASPCVPHEVTQATGVIDNWNNNNTVFMYAFKELAYKEFPNLNQGTSSPYVYLQGTHIFMVPIVPYKWILLY